MPKKLPVTSLLAAAVSLSSTACFPNSDSIRLPPPVRDGRCLVAHWVGDLATDQACQLGGYSWHCVADPAKGQRDQQCDRGPEVAEVPARVVTPEPTK